MSRVRIYSLLGLVAAWFGLATAFGVVRPASESGLGRTPSLSPAGLSSTARRAVQVPVDDQLRMCAEGKETAETPASPKKKSQLIFPGGGIFFYWQAGAVTHLREAGYDLSSVSMSGASAGALTATLASTGVDFRNATDLALRFAHEAGVWDRPLGLQGVWGPLIERWLDDLLPEDAHKKANEVGLQLLVTPVPSFGKTKVTDFADRADLIRANMASIHIPWFLDGKLTTTYREGEHLDGSFLSKATDYVSAIRPKDVVTLDWTKDPTMSDKKLGDFVEALSKEGIWDLVERGRSYAAAMEERGAFEAIPRL